MTRVHHVYTNSYEPSEVQADDLGLYQMVKGERDYLTLWKEGEREVTIHFGDRILTFPRR